MLIVTVYPRQFLDQIFLYGEIEAVSRRRYVKTPSVPRENLNCRRCNSWAAILLLQDRCPEPSAPVLNRRQIGSRPRQLASELRNRPRLAAANIQYQAGSALHRVPCREKSTPRSKRYAESELKPSENDLPAITSGLKKALSRNISVGSGANAAFISSHDTCQRQRLDLIRDDQHVGLQHEIFAIEQLEPSRRLGIADMNGTR